MLPIRLKELRIKNHMTQAELGKKINVAKSTVSMWETGVRSPDTNTLGTLADLFHVSTDYLLGRTVDIDNELAWQDLGMAYGGHIPDELKDMYRAIAEEYVKKHPEALKDKRK